MDSFNTSYLVVIIRVLIVDNAGMDRMEASYKIQASYFIIHYFNNTADNFAYAITNYLLFIHFTIL
jgi:GTPase SAR1 family protein